MRTQLACLLLAPLAAIGADFVNLTFDQPNLNGPLEPLLSGGPYRGNTSDLLQGWTVRADGQPLATMTYSPFLTTSHPPLSLVENSPANAASPLGKYTLYLEALFPTSPEIRLSQTATIPADAVGLWIASAGYVQAFVDGTKVGEVNPEFGSQVTLDVSPYAGKEVNLEFFVRSGDTARFDVFGFTAVPEPSTYALFGVGFALLGWQVWRRRRCR